MKNFREAFLAFFWTAVIVGLPLAMMACVSDHQVSKSGANIDNLTTTFGDDVWRVTDPQYGNVCYVWAHGISCVRIAQ